MGVFCFNQAFTLTYELISIVIFEINLHTYVTGWTAPWREAPHPTKWPSHNVSATTICITIPTF